LWTHKHKIHPLSLSFPFFLSLSLFSRFSLHPPATQIHTHPNIHAQTSPSACELCSPGCWRETICECVSVCVYECECLRMSAELHQSRGGCRTKQILCSNI
uniref:TIL domain-containing protein n=1 Tax=Astyanax mexicanus TaxID=7994 RepID=A0A8B9HG85_ASTMX